MLVRIIKIRERPRIDATGELIYYKEIDYMVGDHGPFSVDMRKDEYTPEAARAKVEAEAAGIKDLASEFEV